MDVAPTVLELAGVEHPGRTGRAGRSCRCAAVRSFPIWRRDGGRPHDDNATGWELFGRCAIRRGDWKALASAAAWSLQMAERSGAQGKRCIAGGRHHPDRAHRDSLPSECGQLSPSHSSMLSDATGRQVTLGHLSFSLFSGSLTADQLSISDDPAFSQQPFVQAQQIHIGIEVKPLIFDKQVKIQSITIDTPKISLIQNQSNVWNYASLGNSSKRSNKPETQSSMPNLSIGALEVKDGQVTITDLGAPTPPRVIQSVQAKISDFSLTTPFTYSLSAAFPGNGTVSVSGKGGPFNQADASKTPFTAKIEVKHADLVGGGFVPPSAGVAGIADLNADLTSNGQTAHVQGTIDATQLKLAVNGSPAPRPVHVNFTMDQNLASLTGQLQNTTLAYGKALFNIAGSYQTQGAKTTLNATASTQGAPINDLEDFLPALGIQMPSGSKLQGGTLTTNLAVTGATDAPVISGPVRIEQHHARGFRPCLQDGSCGRACRREARHRHRGPDSQPQPARSRRRNPGPEHPPHRRRSGYGNRKRHRLAGESIELPCRRQAARAAWPAQPPRRSR